MLTWMNARREPFKTRCVSGRRAPECAVVIFGVMAITQRETHAGALPPRVRPPSLRPVRSSASRVRPFRTTNSARKCGRTEGVLKYASIGRSGILFAAGLSTSRRYRRSGLYPRLAAGPEIENARNTGGNALFCLSTQPSQYAAITLGLGSADLGDASLPAPTTGAA